MSKRTIAMALSVLAGLIFIVIVPKLLSGILRLTAAEDSSYSIGELIVHLLVVCGGVVCFMLARKFWKVTDKEDEEAALKAEAEYYELEQEGNDKKENQSKEET